jgi:MFS family permease
LAWDFMLAVLRLFKSGVPHVLLSRAHLGVPSTRRFCVCWDVGSTHLQCGLPESVRCGRTIEFLIYFARLCLDPFLSVRGHVSRHRHFANPWCVVLGAMLGMIVGNSPMMLFTFGLFLKPVTSEFGWNRATFASAIFASQAFGAFSLPLVGKLIDRYGIRRITLTFIVFFCAATALLSQTRSAGPFILLYGIAGLTGSGRGPVAYTKAISAWFESRRGLALGIAMTGLGIGAVVVPLVTRLLIASFGWRGAYIGLAVIAFAVSFPTVALFIREPENTAGKQPPVARVSPGSLCIPQIDTCESPARSARFWAFIIAVFLISLSLNGTFAHIVPLLTDRGFQIGTATWIVSLAGLAIMAGQFLSGCLLDRFSATGVAGSIFVASLTGTILISFRVPEIVATAGVLCIAFGIGTDGNLAAFLVGRHFGLARFGEIFGYVLAVTAVGNGVGPWLMALCYDGRRSYDLALGGFCLAIIAGIFLISRLGPYRYPANKISPITKVPSIAPLSP